MRLLRHRRTEVRPIDLNVIPLIDVVFFLLIFYVISTAFVQEAAIGIERPASRQAQPVVAGFVPVAIVKDGSIQVGGLAVDLAGTSHAVEAALRDGAADAVVVIPDREVPTGLLLAVMDACSAAGAARVDVAATSGER